MNRKMHANSLANLHPPWMTGFCPNPEGRNGARAAGATLKELVNRMVNRGLTESEALKIWKDKDQPIPIRAAAEHYLRLVTRHDHADFVEFTKGTKDIAALKKEGIDTSIVRKIKQKSRVVPIGDGETEEVIDRELEITQDARATFEMLVTQTDGSPATTVNLNSEVHHHHTIETDEFDDLVRKRMNAGNPTN